ncbi:MAG: hypothetical protein JF616_03140 [Fibrobacteres bacterium]|nr:hypothetical protein [Fibrobacterota bacterium]
MPVKTLLLALLGALFPASAIAQITYREDNIISQAQTGLPSQGPAAARFNPAALADVHRVSVAVGNTGWTSMEYRQTFGQLAFGWPQDKLSLPIGLAAGFGYFGGIKRLDATNIVNDEGEYVPGIAAVYPADPDAPYRIAAGMDLAIVGYNAFNAVHSHGVGMDIGLDAAHTNPHGRLDLGFAYHHFISPKARLPDEVGSFKIPGWMEPSLAWASAGRLVHARMGLFFNEPHDPKEGSAQDDSWGMNGWDVELRPFQRLAFKFERTRFGPLSDIGFILFPPASLGWLDFRLEVNFGHTAYVPPVSPPFGHFLFGSGQLNDGTRWMLGTSLTVGI